MSIQERLWAYNASLGWIVDRYMQGDNSLIDQAMEPSVRVADVSLAAASCMCPRHARI